MKISNRALALLLLCMALSWVLVVGLPAVEVIRRVLSDLAVRGRDRPLFPSSTFVAIVAAASLGLALSVMTWRRDVAFRATALLLAFGIAVFVVGAQAIGAAAWLVIFGVAALELGYYTLRWMRLTADPLETAALQAVVGSGVLGLIGLTLSTVAGLRRTPLLLLFAVLSVSFIFRVRPWRQRGLWRGWRVALASTDTAPLTAFEITLLALTASDILIGIAVALAPEVQSDAVRLHLGMARIFAGVGALPALDYIYPSQWPVNGQTLYAMAMVLHDAIAAKLLHTASGIATILFAGLLARRLAGRRAAIIAAALVATLPLMMWELGTAYVDLFASCYAAAAVLSLFEWQDTGNVRWAGLIGVLLGFAVASKLTVGASVAGLFAAVVLMGRRSTVERVRAASWMAMAFAAVLAPWLVRSMWLTGQIPAFEILAAAVKQHFGLDARALGSLQKFGLGFDLSAVWKLPWEIVFHSDRFGENPPGYIGFVLLLGLPALCFVRWSRQSGTLGVAILVSGALWFLSAQYLRYVLPILTMASVLIATGIDRFAVVLRTLPRGAVAGRGVLATTLVALMASAPVVYLDTMFAYPGELPVNLLLHRESPDDYFLRKVRQAVALEKLSKLVTAGTPVAVFAEGSQMYSDAALWGVFNGAGWLLTDRNEQELVKNFTRSHMDYLIVDEDAAEQWDRRPLLLQPAFLDDHAEILYAAGGVYLYRMHASQPLAANVSTSELLTNPGFESEKTGTPEGWAGGAGAVFDDSGQQSHSGRGAVEVTTTASFTQAVDITGGRHYLLSHFSRCDSPGALVRLQVNFSDAAGKYIGTALEVRRGSKEYTPQRMWLEAPPSAAHAVIYASTHAEARCWFDDFSFREAAP